MNVKVKSSIFNDVLGPVMRGPSSSHTAASWRIARIAVQILNDELLHALIEFDRHGTWASNYLDQGTTLGMNGGLMGIDMTDELILDHDAIAQQRGLNIEYRISDFHTDHPNTMRISLQGVNGKSLSVTAVSIGGGMIEIRKLNNFEIKLYGDNHMLALFFGHELHHDLRKKIELECPAGCSAEWSADVGKVLLIVRSSKDIPDEFIRHLRSNHEIDSIAKVAPVLPIISGNEKEFPFDSVSSMLKFGYSKKLSLGELGLLYEQSRSGLDKEALISKMKELITIIENSISRGLEGTVYQDRILHHQSHLIAKAAEEGRIMSDMLTNNIISNVTALMESKSSMGIIVASPTAGSCGTLGGTLKAMADHTRLNDEIKILAYFAAGMIGVFIAEGPGFSAEAFGCQVECGAASSMTAAALVELSGGDAKQAVDAASMAYQNMIGLICDPIADRVEAPCLGKNISAAMNALSSSTMSLAGFDAVIPLDQVIRTVSTVGQNIPFELRCTGLGGLSVTPRALEIKGLLKKMGTERSKS
jgi:L-serine dehydratase